MRYLSWAGYYEGNSDRQYFEVLIPRLLTDVISREGTRPIEIPETYAVFGLNDRTVEAVSLEACDNRNLFYIWFIHADFGGRGVARSLDSRSTAYATRANERCELPLERSVLICPRKETETWVMSDRKALFGAFGLGTDFSDESLPTTPHECESFPDPKSLYSSFAKRVNPRRYKSGASFLFANIALSQDLNILRLLPSFQEFESNLKRALRSLNCIP